MKSHSGIMAMIMRTQMLIPLLIRISACNNLSTEPDANLSLVRVDFTGGCGQATNGSNVAQSAGMQPLQEATVNGRPVSECVIGHDATVIYGIGLSKTTGSYEYQVAVDGSGPRGFGSGPFWLAFTDEAGNTYSLAIYSSTRTQHTLRYSSDKPNIVKIWWGDHHFSVPSTVAAQPDYRVTSSADSRSWKSEK